MRRGRTGAVDVSGPWRELQEFAVTQQQQGMLVCLCSKNNPADVEAVFTCRPEMPLRPEHIVARRINWESKAANLRELAAELKLGLDSFIFVDDSPVECAAMLGECPDVLTVQLPGDPQEAPGLLKRLWAFDRWGTTQEDRERTRMYRESVAREQVRKTSLSLADFLESLAIEISITVPESRDLERLSQLTQRTNQFNATTIRRTEGEVCDALQGAGLSARIVSVRDRFGDYGLVGAMLFAQGKSSICVETFLLSCRALGRGVEHAMLRHVGELAVSLGVPEVIVDYRHSSKNEPARRFLDLVSDVAELVSEDEKRYRFDAQSLSRLKYTPDCDADAEVSDMSIESVRRAPASSAQKLVKIAHDNSGTAGLLCQMRAMAVRTRPRIDTPHCPPRSRAEQTVTEVWEQILKIQGIGMHDRFAELGGSSLQAVQLIVALNRRTGYDLTTVDLFEHSTIAALVERAERGQDNTPLASSRTRGTQRRQRVRRSRRHQGDNGL